MLPATRETNENFRVFFLIKFQEESQHWTTEFLLHVICGKEMLHEVGLMTIL